MKKVSKKTKKIKKTLLFSCLSCVVLIITLIFIIGIVTKTKFSIDPRINSILEYNKSNGEGEIKAQFWLKMQGTNIDYPVINGRMDYVKLDEVKGNFLWTNRIYDHVPNKLIIFGHNIRNLSANPIIANKKHEKFEQLPSFLYYDFAKDNQYIQLSSKDNDYIYKIFSVSIVKDKEIDYESSDLDTADFEKYIKDSIDKSIYDYNIEVKSDDKIISLITCTRIYGANSDYDLRVDARMVRKGELTNKYKVSKNKNYKKIENAMRGDINGSNV